MSETSHKQRQAAWERELQNNVSITKSAMDEFLTYAAAALKDAESLAELEAAHKDAKEGA